MRATRRFVGDEAGMTLPLAMIMIVLIGVMGAGLLAFTNRDINTVVEENRGQRAFEMADAGIQAAKNQLASSVDRTIYDGDGVPTTDYDPATDGHCGSDDAQWSALRCGTPKGLTLQDLNGDGDSTDSVNVKIYYRSPTDDFRVVSTGTYGNSTRKIEALFKGISLNAAVADALGHPLYYTPSNIKIQATETQQVDLKDISLFTGGDILIQDEDSTQFIDDMKTSSNGVLGRTGTADALENWYSPDYPVDQGRGPWNTQKRKENSLGGQYSGMNPSNDLLQPGLAAAGKVCRWQTADEPIGACPAASPSIADGVYAYDCTTGPVDLPDAVCTSPPNSRGNGLTFVDKQPQDKALNDANTITFPFPRPTPIAKNFHKDAVSPTGARVTCSGVSTECTPDFKTIFQGLSNPKLVFVDANGKNVHFDATGNPSGVLVVWCGHLVQESQFTGIVLNLYGDGSSFTSPVSSCIGDKTKGTYTNTGVQFSGWNYAAGGTPQLAGIEIKQGSTIRKYPGATWSLLDDSQFTGPPPSSFTIQSWRELYK